MDHLCKRRSIRPERYLQLEHKGIFMFQADGRLQFHQI